jgi:hypothetical protein
MNVTGGYHLEVATSCDLNLSVEIMQGVCPTDNVYLDRDDTPDVYTYSGITLKKFILTSTDADGAYFIRIRDPTFSIGQMMLPNAYSLSLSTASCSDPCVFGSCASEDHCSCFPHWSGTTCTLYNPPAKNDHDDDDDDDKDKHHHSPSSNHHDHHDHHSSSSDDHDKHHHNSSDGLSGGAIAGITIGSIAGVVCFVVVLILLSFCLCCCVRKKDSHGIYALITTESDV